MSRECPQQVYPMVKYCKLIQDLKIQLKIMKLDLNFEKSVLRVTPRGILPKTGLGKYYHLTF